MRHLRRGIKGDIARSSLCLILNLLLTSSIAAPTGQHEAALIADDLCQLGQSCRLMRMFGTKLRRLLKHGALDVVQQFKDLLGQIVLR